MADSFVQLPDDSTNTGKKIRTVTRTVGLNEVHEHFFVIQDPVNDVQLRIYQEGDTATTVAGFAPLMEVAANELRPLQGTVADGLLVNLGSNNDVTVTGSVTANAGTNLNTSSLALEAGGNLAAAATSLAIIDDVVFTDDTSTHSTGSTKGVGIMAVATPTDAAVNANDIGMVAMSLNRELHVLPRANSGVDIGDVDVTSVIPGTGASNLGKAEDAGHTTGDVGVFVLGVRNTANTTSTSADRDYAPISTDLWDAPISGIRRQSTTLTAINTTYDDSPTTATSATVDSSMFRMGIFVAEVTESGTATDITFTLQMSPDGSTWYDYRVGPWVKYRFDDATIAAHSSNTLKICEPFMINCSNIRMLVTTNGTDASNSFTVANAKFELQN